MPGSRHSIDHLELRAVRPNQQRAARHTRWSVRLPVTVASMSAAVLLALGPSVSHAVNFGLADTYDGGNALASETTGNNNSAFGWYALNANTTGGGNTGVGSNALENNSSGGGNTATGAGTWKNYLG